MRSTYRYSRPVTRKPQVNPNQLLLEWSVAPVAEVPLPKPDAPQARTVTQPPAPPKRPLRESLERFLRERGVPYINVDEAKRALFSGAKLRSFHFVVYRTNGKNWLVFAAQLRKESRQDLHQWEGIFGDGFVAVVARQWPDGQFRFRTLAGETVAIF